MPDAYLMFGCAGDFMAERTFLETGQTAKQPWLRFRIAGRMPAFRKVTAEGFERVNINRERVFVLFKYTVYLLLTINTFIFFGIEWEASAVLFESGVTFWTVYDAFTATIDTGAWVVLLLLFELETYVLSDEHFTRKVTWTLHGVRFFAYFFIVLAFVGYVEDLTFTLGASPMQIADLCSLANSGWSYGADINDFTLLTADNCGQFSGAEAYFQYPGVSAVVGSEDFVTAKWLAWTDVINAGVWLLIVLVLEADVRLQERDMLIGKAYYISTGSKIVLYSTLVWAAIYWTIDGGFIDSYDAWMWLIAFVFIELNVFEWRQESLEEEQSGQAG